MKIDDNQQDKWRIKRQMCGCSFLDLVIFELTVAIFTQNQKSRSLYYQFTQSHKFLLGNINLLKSYSKKCVFPLFSKSHTIYDQHHSYLLGGEQRASTARAPPPPLRHFRAKSALQVWFREKFSLRFSSWVSEYVNLRKITLPTILRNLTRYFFPCLILPDYIKFYFYWKLHIVFKKGGITFKGRHSLYSVPVSFCILCYEIFLFDTKSSSNF